MWITRTTDYATRVVLALALTPSDKAVTAQELSRRTQAPTSTLEQIMPVLRRAGIVRSERGRRGGYALNHDPAEVTLERVVRLFQGQLAPIACATRKEPAPCPMSVGCSLRFVWEELRDLVIDRLSSATFADLADKAGGPWIRHTDLSTIR